MSEDNYRRKKLVESPEENSEDNSMEEDHSFEKNLSVITKKKGIISDETRKNLKNKISESLNNTIPENIELKENENLKDKINELILNKSYLIKEKFIKTLDVERNNIIPIFNNTKYLEFNQISDVNNILESDMSDSEKFDKIKSEFNKKEPSGFKLNLNGSGYFIIDVDNDLEFSAVYDYDTFNEDLKIKNEFKFYSFPPIGCKKLISSKDKDLNFFAQLFNTLFVITPNNGYHFYFKNDLTEVQIKSIFGSVARRYTKINERANMDIPIDVFIDIGEDVYITLPVTKLGIRNPDNSKNENKFIYKSYSTFNHLEDKINIKNASEFIDIFKKMFIYNEEYDHEREYQEELKNKENKPTIYQRRAFAFPDEKNKLKCINFFERIYNLIDEKEKVIHHYSGYSMWQHLLSIIFLPDDIQETILDLFISKLGHKFSEKTWERLKREYVRTFQDNKINLRNTNLTIESLKRAYGIELENPNILYIFDNERSFEFFKIKKEDLGEIIFDIEEMFKNLHESYPKLKI